MYRLLRNTHLLFGLFLCATVLMYGVSSVQMVHRTWWPWSNVTIEKTVTLGTGFADGRQVARALMDGQELWGDLTQVAAIDGGFQLRVARPGEVTDAVYRSDSGQTRLKTQRADFQGMLVALHHAHGLSHEPFVVKLWGVMLGLTSLGLMVLGGTGVYLWFHIHKERVAGGLILAVSLGFSLTLIVLIRIAQ